jgi:hypothetical protein
MLLAAEGVTKRFGAGLYACRASVDMFKLSEADFVSSP